MPSNNLPPWSELKRELAGCSNAELLEIIRDLFNYSGDNRHFLVARSSAPESRQSALEGYRRRIVQEFFPERGHARVGLGEARRAIGDYRRASRDMEGTLDLMLAYVETGTRYLRECGPLDEQFSRSMHSVLDDVVKLLTTPEGVDLYAPFRDRIIALAREAPRDSYGNGIRERVSKLEGDVWQH